MLSTPHGTLGTSQTYGSRGPKEALSTPHGTLGTELLEREGFERVAFNSTRYIRNNRVKAYKEEENKRLSTPHGTLGTVGMRVKFVPYQGGLSTPHGTLGTRNKRKRTKNMNVLSTPHGTLGTLSLMNTKGSIKALSTPHGTLGTSRRKTLRR